MIVPGCKMDIEASAKIISVIRPILKAVRRGFSRVGILPIFMLQRFASAGVL
jgi:hypothetical protein